MANNRQHGPNTSNSAEQTAGAKRLEPTQAIMAPQERKQQVLAVLEDSGVAMKSVDIFRNCKLRGATFERRTTKNYLTDLVESGDVLKVESEALGSGEIVEVDSGERGHFIAASVADQYQHDSKN